jgi:hypothetical protein
MNDSKASFNAHRDAEKRIESAKNTIKVLLSAELYEPHLVELLKICIWKLSLAEGRSKYKTRYKSVRSLDNPPKNLHHEHVFETSKLIKELRTDPRGIGRIVAKAVACVVTRKEHKNLTKLSRGRPDLHGWDRYQAAGIQVIDTKTGKCLDWPACSEG